MHSYAITREIAARIATYVSGLHVPPLSGEFPYQCHYVATEP
jgi:hypothetical protein